MDILPIRRHQRHPANRRGPRNAGPRGVRSHRRVAQSPARLADAATDPRRGPFEAVVRHRRGPCGDTAPSLAARCGAWRHDSRCHKSAHQPGRQADLEAAPPKSPVWCRWRDRAGGSRHRTRFRRATPRARPPSPSASASRTHRSGSDSHYWRDWWACRGWRPARTIPAMCSPASASAPPSPCVGARIVPPTVPTKIPTADPLRLETPARPQGEGVVLVINPASGSGTGARVVEEVREALPAAEIVELDGAVTTSRPYCAPRPTGPRFSLSEAATARCRVAQASRSSPGLPLAVFPGGTFNHFAKDIECDTVAKTAEAIRQGSAAYVDVVCLNESHMVVNTASIGAYPQFVQTREKLEHKIGKPLAGIYAMFHTLRRDEPVRIRYDNKSLQTSLFFLGNSTYLPSGFAPSRRTRMDDGLMDVRILETGRTVEQAAHSRVTGAGPIGAQPAVSRDAGARIRVHRGRRLNDSGSRRRGRHRMHGCQLHRSIPGSSGISSAAVIDRRGGRSNTQTTK